jgi:hypothetical protein
VRLASQPVAGVSREAIENDSALETVVDHLAADRQIGESISINRRFCFGRWRKVCGGVNARRQKNGAKRIGGR